MDNYSINASFYAYPFQVKKSGIKGIEIYCDKIKQLYDLIFSKHPQYRRFFLFDNDLKLIRKIKELNLSMQDTSLINQIDQTLKEHGSLSRMRSAQYLFDMIISKISSKKYEYIMFEKWFNIEDVEFINNNYPSLPKEVNDEINNEDLKENTLKNIAKIAYLNKYVYKSDILHNIILNNSISIQSIPVDTEFNIKMTNWQGNQLNYNYKIKNAPLKNIIINNKNVNISTLNAFINKNFKYKLGDWETALNAAKNHFKENLEFGLEVDASLIEYKNKIIKESKKLFGANKQKFNEWMKEGPDTLYENLKALNDFIANGSIQKVTKNKDERYHCCNTEKCHGQVCHEYVKVLNYNCDLKCEFLEVCCSNIRYFGVDCVDEYLIHKKNKDVEIDRTRTNSKGAKSIYWIHLRPQNLNFDSPLGFMSLRIHLRPLADKIEIGWIGRHLYLPA
jgi:hypothetical protein